MEPTEQTQPMRAAGKRSFRREPALLAICIVLLLLAVVPPLVNLHRYQLRIAEAISRSVGRPVSMDAVALQLLPWPGLRITNLVVGEDPAFGAEPALRAPAVVAQLRLSSLWRGRFELSRVEISDASVNLVRNPNGRWNVSSVLLEASHVTNAPTGQVRPGPAPRFPYIEATGTRINLKRGVEKLPYSLVNADFSMSLDRPEVWRLKLEGQPVRTDLELFLSDTGTLRVEGELHRASALGAMPLAMEAEWSHLPMGQGSRMLLGRDAGWRGEINLQARLRGEVDALDVRTHVVVANLHRQEFTPEQPFAVDAACEGHYSRLVPVQDTLRCRWPLGRGALTLERSGLVSEQTGPADWTLGLDRVPATVAVAAVGLLRPGPHPQVSGEFTGSYGYGPATRQWTGSAAATSVAVSNPGGSGTPLTLGNVQAVASGEQTTLRLTADPLDMGIPGSPVMLSAEVLPGGYRVQAAGAGTLDRLRPLAGLLRVPGIASLAALPGSDEGATARLALTASGTWTAAPPQRTLAGTVHFENVRWTPAWLPFPVDLRSADAAVAPGLLRWSTTAAAIGGESARSQFSGHAEAPLGCMEGKDCTTRFSLSAASLDVGVLGAAFGSRSSGFSNLLNRFDAPPLPAMEGTVRAGVLTVGRLPVHEVSLLLAVGGAPNGAVELRSIDGRMLGGGIHLQGMVTPGSTPAYALRGSVTGASARAAAALWDENWGPGTLGGTFALSLAGRGPGELAGSAKGTFEASWLGGSLGEAMPHFASWNGSGRFEPEGLRIEASTFAGTAATATGVIGWYRGLTLQLTPAPDVKPVAVGGTLASPSVDDNP